MKGIFKAVRVFEVISVSILLLMLYWLSGSDIDTDFSVLNRTVTDQI